MATQLSSGSLRLPERPHGELARAPERQCTHVINCRHQ